MEGTKFVYSAWTESGDRPINEDQWAIDREENKGKYRLQLLAQSPIWPRVVLCPYTSLRPSFNWICLLLAGAHESQNAILQCSNSINMFLCSSVTYVRAYIFRTVSPCCNSGWTSIRDLAFLYSCWHMYGRRRDKCIFIPLGAFCCFHFHFWLSILWSTLGRLLF